MAGSAGIGAGGGQDTVALGGQRFREVPGGPAYEQFEHLGGAYRAAWDQVADQLQTTDKRQIALELKRQATEQHGTPEAAARAIHAEATRPLPRAATSRVDTEQMAAHLAALARSDPQHAAQVRDRLSAMLSAGDQSRLAQDIQAATRFAQSADARLATLGSDAPATGRISAQDAVRAMADQLLREVSVSAHGQAASAGLDRQEVPELAYRIETLAAGNPALARAVRADLANRLPPEQANHLNRALAGEAPLPDRLASALDHPIEAAKGAVKGIVNGGAAVLDLLARGSMLRSAGEQERNAAIQSMIGRGDLATQAQSLAAGLREQAAGQVVPDLPYRNVAQAGGADVGTAIDIAMAGKGLISGGARLARQGAKAADEMAGATGHGAAAAARQLDRFDQIAGAAKIDMAHIADGHLNASGRAVGFHARPGGVDPVTSRMVTQTRPANAEGVYTGRVEVRDPASGNWVAKKAESSFYPDAMSKGEVEQAIRTAYADALRTNKVTPAGKFLGDSGHGFQIEGYSGNGNIRTAYPLYK